MEKKYTCLVCGWKGLDVDPTLAPYDHEICSCCSSQYGLDIQNKSDIEIVRKEWLNDGAEWFNDEEGVQPRKPENWDIQMAKKQISDSLPDYLIYEYLGMDAKG